MRLKISTLALALALSGCAMTPEFVRPEAPVASMFPASEEGQEIVGGTSAGELGWRTMFLDARLQLLIEAALRNNRDLRIATFNVEAAQAEVRIRSADRWPSVEATGGVVRERSRASMPAPTNQSQMNVGLGVSAFEIDLWGRAKSLSEASFARYLASDEGRRAAQVSLVGAVADAYFADLLAVEQLEVARRTFANWTDHRNLALQLKHAMQNSALDVAQAESQRARAEGDVKAKEREALRTRNVLAQLIAIPLESLSLPEAVPLEEQPLRTQLSAGLPSDLLVNRPDVRQAEQLLRAANADIGAARAAFFPRVSLTASLGLASSELDGLFRGSSRVWSFAPSVSLPLFNAGRLKGELRVSELRKLVAVAEYERAVQTAFREVADGLAGTATYTNQIDSQERLIAQERLRASLAQQRYRAGVDGRLEWLDAQRQMYSAQMELLALRAESLRNSAALYKALGGGSFRCDIATR